MLINIIYLEGINNHMPIDRGSHISAIVEEIKHINPNSILDVGIGFGLFGAIFRAYTDIRWSEVYPERYGNWQTRIDGIEIFPEYRNPLWKVYNYVSIGDALEKLNDVNETLAEKYDLVYSGDMIEHFTKENGHILIGKMLKKGRNVIIATPYPTPPQDPVLGNEHERHLSEWTLDDFLPYTHEIVGCFNGILVVKLKGTE